MKKRYHLNAPGDFYTLEGECISCMTPHTKAPALMGYDEDIGHCYFKRQPNNDDEIEEACQALDSSCCAALRYSGNDPKIILRLRALGVGSQCDSEEEK